jgi:N-acetylglucosamine kinase-like BadF-type ATPase
MKLKITILVVTLLICLSAGSYYTVSNATEYTKDKTREHYNQLRNNLTQQKEDLDQLLNESKNDPTAKAKIGEKLKELRSTAIEVNTLAKEVDEDAYYRNKIKSFVNALEITIEDEKITLKNTDSPLDPKQAEIFQKVIKEKEELLEDCKKIDAESVENPKLVYEELTIKVREITS